MQHEDKQFISSKQLWWLASIMVSFIVGITIQFINPIFIALGIILIVNVIIIIKYPFWGLLLYLLVFLLRPGELYPAIAALRIEFLLGTLALIVIIWHQKYRTGKVIFPTDRITLSLVAFLVVMFLSMFTSYEKTETINTCEDFAKILIFYYLIISIIDTRKKFVGFVFLFVIMIAKIAFDAWKLYLSGGFIHTMGVDRLVGTTSAGGDPNALAATMTISIPIILATAMYFKNWLAKAALTVLSGSMIYLIAITGSRAGLLALLGIMAGGFIFTKHKVLVIITTGVLLVMGWSLLPEQYQTRYRTMTNIEDINETSSGRIEVWTAGAKMIFARPILGVGAGAFMWAAGSGSFGYSQFMQAHNLIIQITATTGIIGLAVWLTFMFNSARKLKELFRKAHQSSKYHWIEIYSKAFTISIIALFVAGMFGHNLYRYNWYMIAGLTTALYSILIRMLDEQYKKPAAANQVDKVIMPEKAQ